MYTNAYTKLNKKLLVFACLTIVIKNDYTVLIRKNTEFWIASEHFLDCINNCFKFVPQVYT